MVRVHFLLLSPSISLSLLLTFNFTLPGTGTPLAAAFKRWRHLSRAISLVHNSPPRRKLARARYRAGWRQFDSIFSSKRAGDARHLRLARVSEKETAGFIDSRKLFMRRQRGDGRLLSVVLGRSLFRPVQNHRRHARHRRVAAAAAAAAGPDMSRSVVSGPANRGPRMRARRLHTLSSGRISATVQTCGWQLQHTHTHTHTIVMIQLIVFVSRDCARASVRVSNHQGSHKVPERWLAPCQPHTEARYYNYAT